MTLFDLERIGAGLAFAPSVPELQRHLRSGLCVVQAPAGTGKTTLVPPVVANSTAQRVVVTAPRRIAVRAAARRLSQLTGTKIGTQVGYTFRGERVIEPGAVIEFLTPGVLLRRLMTDPELVGVGAVILDEVHERSVDTDLLLGMLTDLRQLRHDLTVVAMSATLDSDKLSATLGAAPVLTAEGVQYPVRIDYARFDGLRFTERGADRKFLTHVAAVTNQVLDESGDDDVLIFLPGQAEIRFVEEAVRRAQPRVEVLPLYSARPAEEQQRILQGREDHEPRRVIIASSVAESSLTVPGVRIVVDSVLAREPRRDQQRGMTGLVTITASQASAAQRAGRAGRLGPGRAVRCIDEATLAAAQVAPRPEILTVDLTDAALQLACWGTPGGEGLSLLDPLPQAALADAHSELIRLGALDEELRPSNLGRRLARMPLDPRLGRALIDASKLMGAREAAQIVALLAADVRAEGADMAAVYRVLRDGKHPASRTWRNETKRLLRHLNQADTRADARQELQGLSLAERVGYVAALGQGRLARRDGDSYLLTSGTRASLPQNSPLDDQEWLTIIDAARSTSRHTLGTGAIIYAAAPVPTRCIDDLFSPSTHRIAALHDGRVYARVERTLGAIVLSSTPVASQPGENATAITEYVRSEGLGALRWNPAARRLRGRLQALHTHIGEPWPDVHDEALQQTLDEWLTPHITKPAIKEVPLTQALRTLVPWSKAHELDELAPENITVPSGRSVALTYPEGEGNIVVAVKLQECFGLATSPRILGGKIALTFELLSPAGSVLALTQDLEYFWREVYPQVRAENRARYAKHPWPEDPLEHVATAATTAQLRRR